MRIKDVTLTETQEEWMQFLAICYGRPLLKKNVNHLMHRFF